MNFKTALNESYKRYQLRYKGTQPNYEIHDKRPYILSLDDEYNPDNNGESILGINLNYYSGDIQRIIDAVNKVDNKEGYRRWNLKKKAKQIMTRDSDKYENWLKSKKLDRYNNFEKNFPRLSKYIRRYKLNGPKGTGVQSRKRVK